MKLKEDYSTTSATFLSRLRLVSLFKKVVKTSNAVHWWTITPKVDRFTLMQAKSTHSFLFIHSHMHSAHVHSFAIHLSIHFICINSVSTHPSTLPPFRNHLSCIHLSTLNLSIYPFAICPTPYFNLHPFSFHSFCSYFYSSTRSSGFRLSTRLLISTFNT